MSLSMRSRSFFTLLDPRSLSRGKSSGDPSTSAGSDCRRRRRNSTSESDLPGRDDLDFGDLGDLGEVDEAPRFPVLGDAAGDDLSPLAGSILSGDGRDADGDLRSLAGSVLDSDFLATLPRCTLCILTAALCSSSPCFVFSLLDGGVTNSFLAGAALASVLSSFIVLCLFLLTLPRRILCILTAAWCSS